VHGEEWKWHGKQFAYEEEKVAEISELVISFVLQDIEEDMWVVY